MNIINILNYPTPTKDFKVLVRCFTYNQREYIQDTLNGFVIQQTVFPFVCLVIDDASNDGEQEVLKSWMDRECDMSKAEIIDIPTSQVIILPHKTNKFCAFAFYLLKQNLYDNREKKMEHVHPWRMRCTYEAICEGDDYWIDPLKLQKQVDVLESDSAISMVYTAFSTVDQTGNTTLRKFHQNALLRSKSGLLLPDLLKGNFIMNLTTCFRTEVLENKLFDYTGPVYDYYYFLKASAMGKLQFIPDVTANYRANPNSLLFTDRSRVEKGLWEIFCFFSLKFAKKMIGNEYSICDRCKTLFFCEWTAFKMLIKRKDKHFFFILTKAILGVR